MLVLAITTETYAVDTSVKRDFKVSVPVDFKLSEFVQLNKPRVAVITMP